MPEKVSILLPTLNEEENIVRQIRELWRAIPNLSEILILDDNSSDRTVTLVEETFSQEISIGRLRIDVSKEPPGLTRSLRRGVMLSSNPVIGWMDADLSMPAQTLRQMLNKLEEGYDVCVGTRFQKGGKQKTIVKTDKDSRTEIFLSTFLNWFLNTVLRLPITDFTSGFIVVRKSFLENITWRGSHGEYFMDLILQLERMGAKIVEIPYRCESRKFGHSKTFGTFKVGMVNCCRYFYAVLRVFYAKATGI